MAIDSLGSSTAINYNQYSITSPSVTPAQDSDGDNDGSVQAAPGAGGRFATAIEATLAQLTSGSTSSTTASSSSTTSSGSQNATQAEQAFAQSLFSALQSQFSSQQSSAQPSGAEGGGHHHHHHGGGGGGRLASAIEGLAQQLGSSSSSTSGTSDATSTPAASSDLQTSFNNLLAATGQSGSSTTLSQFLQSLGQNLQGGGSSGNLLNVKV